MKIASWNINSVRLRLDLLQGIKKKYDFDILCLQETKVQDDLFPIEEIKRIGYKHMAFRGEKSYNGVAILAKIPIKESFFYNMCDKGDKRHIAVKLANDLVIHNFYIPAGGDVADVQENPKFKHKLDFVQEMTVRFSKTRLEKTIILGDFNIAPYENDVWSHKQLLDVVSHTPVEVSNLTKLNLSQNWLDAQRYFVSLDKKLYSWWSYRARDWEKSDRGRRLDHIWLTRDLEPILLSAEIHKEVRRAEKPSDHAVISVSLDL
jgi:exodeoxyribonuclease-3